MTLNDYQTASKRRLSPDLTREQALTVAALGLAGEAGEVVEPVKKHLFHGRDLDSAHIAAELGDVLWYVAAMATTLGLSLDDIAAGNVEKLLRRPPVGRLPPAPAARPALEPRAQARADLDAADARAAEAARAVAAAQVALAAAQVALAAANKNVEWCKSELLEVL